MSDEQRAARRVLDAYERSGYGGDSPYRYTPAFDLRDVLILARAVSSPGGNSDGI